MEQAMAALMAARANAEADGADPADIGPETQDVMTLIHGMLRAMQTAEDMRDATDLRIAALKVRAKRYDDRAQSYRAASFAAFDALGSPGHKFPDMTVSIAAGRPGVLILDENAIPPEFTRTKVEPDKTKIKAALDRGEEVPGAILTNPIPTMTVRGS